MQCRSTTAALGRPAGRHNQAASVAPDALAKRTVSQSRSAGGGPTRRCTAAANRPPASSDAVSSPSVAAAMAATTSTRVLNDLNVERGDAGAQSPRSQSVFSGSGPTRAPKLATNQTIGMSTHGMPWFLSVTTLVT